VLNKHCSETLQGTLLNSVSNDLPPFTVKHSHDSFTLPTVKDVMLVQHCQQSVYVLCTGDRREAFWSKLKCQVACFCVH
jgi:hypothetical protein